MEENILAELQMITLKEEPSSTISPKIPSSVVSPCLNEVDQEMSQNDIDVSSKFPVTPGQTEMWKKLLLLYKSYCRLGNVRGGIILAYFRSQLFSAKV